MTVAELLKRHNKLSRGLTSCYCKHTVQSMKIKLLLLEATCLKPSKLLLPQSPHSVMILHSKRTNRFNEIRKHQKNWMKGRKALQMSKSLQHYF